MTKEDLAINLSRTTDLTAVKARVVVQTIFDTIKSALVKSDKPVILRGFGTFHIKHKNARNGRNPKTGEPVQISARRVVTFKASGTLKKDVNNAN